MSVPFLLGLTLAVASGPALEAPRTVVLVTLDTTRADHLGCYGYQRPTTPFLDTLARQGLVFENALAAISHTAPSHATLFTGLYPSQHGVRVNGQDMVPEGAYVTLAELFQRGGYATAAFTGVEFVFGVARGFRYIDVGGHRGVYRQADETVSRVLDWLRRQRPDERIFLWVHLFDAHTPHRAPAKFQERLRYASAAAEARFGREQRERRAIPEGFFRRPEEVAREFQRYDAEIRFADHELNRLFDAFGRAGRNRDALWIVTADHGEGLGSHGYAGHGRFLHREQVRVPLILHATRRRAGARIRSLVRHVDVFPTLAQLLGEEPKQPGFTLPGISLLPLLDDPAWPVPPAMAFLERRPKDAERADWEEGDVFGVQDLDWKYIAKTEGGDELYDLRDDPLELRNLIESYAPVGERLSSLARSTWARLRGEGAQVSPRPVDKSLEEGLRALGYVN